MTTDTDILGDTATLAALLHVIADEQPNLDDIPAQNRVTWLLRLAVRMADEIAEQAEQAEAEAEALTNGATKAMQMEVA